MNPYVFYKVYLSSHHFFFSIDNHCFCLKFINILTGQDFPLLLQIAVGSDYFCLFFK